jgi:Putative peptidoglycan binding domain/Glycosyl hydrolase family 26
MLAICGQEKVSIPHTTGAWSCPGSAPSPACLRLARPDACCHYVARPQGRTCIARPLTRENRSATSGSAAARRQAAGLALRTVDRAEEIATADHLGGSWPMGRRRDVVSGAHVDMPAGELETSTLRAYPKVVRTGYELADHTASNRTGLPTLGEERCTESGVTRCLSLAFATQRQSRAHGSGELLCWLPGRDDSERVTVFSATGSARWPACQLDRRDPFCHRTMRETLSARPGLDGYPGLSLAVGLPVMIRLKTPRKIKWRVVLICLAVFVGITASTVPAWISLVVSANPTLRIGSTGSAVKTLQTRLNAWNVQPHVALDGNFGLAAKIAVEEFQAVERLTVDGIVGPATWADLLKTPPVNPPAITASGVVDSDLEALLSDGGPDHSRSGYYESASAALVAAAAGTDNRQFYQLGELLVRDRLANTIINLSREMNGSWYEWSEQHAPPTEPDAFILAWRQVVTTMRSVPGGHFKFLWSIYPGAATVAEAWPGNAYVDYVGTDIFDWYGGPDNTYPHTASGALDWTLHWQQTLTARPGGLDWIAQFSKLTGKPIIIPEWGLDFHTFGGQDDIYFLTHMTAWLKAHNAVSLYWVGGHVTSSAWPGGPLLVNQGAAAQDDTIGEVNGMGKLLGGHLQYAAVYLDDQEAISDATAQPVLAPWETAGYQLVLSVDVIPNPPSIASYSGPPPPGNKAYQLPDYHNAVAALKQGLE